MVTTLADGSPLSRIAGAALDLLFPPRCVACRAYGSFLCRACVDDLPRAEAARCPVCWQPQGSSNDASLRQGQEKLCADCRVTLPAFLTARAPYRYEGAARQAIIALKYRRVSAIAAPMGTLLADYLTAHPLPVAIDGIVPVPLHPRRQRQRGYNQAALLARAVGRLCNLPLAEGVLMRTRNTPSQVRVADLRLRRRNVADAFICRNDSLKGKTVLLIDDVMTSGATLDACARALIGSGAKAVCGLTLAREE